MFEDIVKKSIEAFNNKDFESSLKYWADDLKIIDLLKEEVFFSSKEEVRQHLKKQIESGQFLPSKLINIHSNGPFVITTEVKDDGKEKSTITLIRYIEDGLIKKMWGASVKEK